MSWGIDVRRQRVDFSARTNVRDNCAWTDAWGGRGGGRRTRRGSVVDETVEGGGRHESREKGGGRNWTGEVKERWLVICKGNKLRHLVNPGMANWS